MHRKTYTKIAMVVLVKIDKIWKQLKCLSTVEMTNCGQQAHEIMFNNANHQEKEN